MKNISSSDYRAGGIVWMLLGMFLLFAGDWPGKALGLIIYSTGLAIAIMAQLDLIGE